VVSTLQMMCVKGGLGLRSVVCQRKGRVRKIWNC